MSIIIGLDVGDIRVGVAISDQKAIKAQSYAVYKRANYFAEKQILEIINKFNAKTLVVGLPLNETNEISQQAEKIRNFCRRIEKRAPINIVYIDEYGSSQQAKQNLGITQQPKASLRKTGMIDAEAAAIILQDYLDQGLHKNTN